MTSDTGSSTSVDVSTPQFLFTDADFESNDFHPASFVAKYRRATSLDSLRSQLRLYCQSLKDQLYNIINRDYKDFITIATKLEGVDHRVEYLRKPLIELRMDLTQLNDTMVSNLHAISGKIQQRREVSSRRRLLESSLACMTKLSNVEDVLNINNNNSSASDSIDNTGAITSTDRDRGVHTATRPRSSSTSSTTNSLTPHPPSRPSLTRRALIQKAVRTKPDDDPERLELYQCSELERAAMALSEAHAHLREEKKTQQQQQQNKGQASSTARKAQTPATVAMRRTLDLRAQSIQVALLARLQLCCHVLLTSTSSTTATTASTAPVSDSGPRSGGGGGGMSPCRRRSLGHLLRGLVVLDSGGIAEALIAELFTVPAVASLLTQGRVDGHQGRGSYSGLGECLGEVVRTVGERVTDTLLLVEEMFPDQGLSPSPPSSSSSSPIAIDLVVNGIWVPVLTTLKQKYAGMFASGMANVFHQCYQATHQFIQELSGICGAEWKESIACRLSAHKSYLEFKNLWKMDLHYQLRAQEVISRLDKSLALTAKHGLASQVFDDIYTSSSSSSSVVKGDKRSNSSSSSSETKLSISTKDIFQTEAAAAVNILTADAAHTLSSSSQITWKLSLTRVFVIEILTCLHANVFLKDLSSKMISLVIKILNCFNVHMLALIDYRGAGQHDSSSLSSPSPSPSPSVSVSSASKTSTPGGTSSMSGSVSLSATHALTLEELTWGISDLLQLAAWIQHSLSPLLLRTLFPSETSPSSSPSLGEEKDMKDEKGEKGENGTSLHTDNRQAVLIQACFDKQVTSVLRLSPLIWTKMADILVVDCRSGLKAVKSVAGKFRMTNKPPPDSPSGYVASILKPLKMFLKKHSSHSNGQSQSEGHSGSVVAVSDVLQASSEWKRGVVESVTATYHQQIEALLATAQQMDTTLQRRSKMGKKSTSGQSDTSNQMSDSEKIALQILLDARAFGEDIKEVCAVTDATEVGPYKLLLAAVDEAQTVIGK